MKYPLPATSAIARHRSFCFLLLLIGSIAPLAAQTWTGASGTSWATPGNWSGGLVPTASGDVIIPATANQPVILNGTAAVAKSVTVQSSANLSVNAGGSLSIDGSTLVQLANQGTVTNAGAITLGALSATAQFGLGNQGTFNNNAGGTIYIDRCSNTGLMHSGGTFDNTGKIVIGGTASTGTNGMYLQANFNNHSGGEIDLDLSSAAGINLESGTLTNAGKLYIGQTASAGSTAIYSSSTLNNNATGEIRIDRGGAAIFNRAGSACTNAGKILVGQLASVGGPGIYSFTSFSNTSSGEITIDRANTGIFNVLGGALFSNAGKIKIGQIASTSINGPGIYTFIPFTNTATGEITIDRSYTGIHTETGSTFTNAGKVNIGQSASLNGAGIYNRSTFNNNAGAELRIDRASTAIQDYSGATFSSAGKIWIGQLAQVSGLGLYDEGSFTNSGDLTIDSTSQTGIHHRTGTFTNTGNIKIGTASSIGGPGLYNEKDFFNNAGSSIVIDRSQSSSSALYNASGANFTNSTTITIGGTVRAGNNGLYNAGTFTNNAGCTISIDHVGTSFGNGLFNSSNASLTNAGTISIGSAVSAGLMGIVNAGTLNNNSGGQISIDHIITTGNNNGIYNQSSATFTNAGKLFVGATVSGGSHGLTNGGTFNNNAGGEMTIDHVLAGSDTHGIYNSFSATFNNTGKLSIGSAGNSGAWGLYNVATFNNNANSELNINNVSIAGLRHDSGTFTNAGKITIGGTASVGNWGIWNQATFNNNSGGEIRIDRAAMTGLRHTTNTFTNSGKIIIGATASVGDWALWTSATFINNACAQLVLYGPLQNSSTFTNNGLLTANTLVAHSNTGLTNNGIIEYPQGNLIPNVINNDLIVQPVSGECSIANALTIGGAYSFTPASTWYQDAGLLVVAGTYNSGANTFSPDASLPQGTNTLYFSVLDNLNNCSQTVSIRVTLNDVTPPTVTCQPATVNLNAAGSGSITAAAVFQSGSDNCGTVNLQSVSPATFSCVSLGTNTVTLTVNDGHGLTATCTTSVMVKDQLPPSINCPANATVAAGVNCTASLASYTAAATASDNCTGSPSKTQSPAAGTTLNLGTQTVTLTATDGSNNSGNCSFSVTVTDQTPPSITCPANTTVAAGASCTATLASYTAAATATDNCTASPAKTQSPAAGTTLNLGTQTVTLTATDAANNSANCSFTVAVTDQTPPSITCPANTTVAAGASCTATLASYTAAATATDNCTASPAKTQSPAAGTTLNLGTQTVTLTATDAANNSANCSFTVAVTDQTPPSITCPANTTVAAGASCTATLASYTAAATATDNCTASPAKTQSPALGTTLNLGTQTVTLTATDAANNSANCSFTVAVTDQTPPTVVCKTVNVSLPANGQATITTADVFQSGADNCGTVNQVSVTPNTFNCNTLGLNTVVLTVNDGHGNTATCTTQAKVFDALLPTVLCKNVTASLDATGSATITPAQVNNGSFDNCSIASLSLSQTTFSCANIGALTVTLTGSDPSNNKGSCQATVTVNDLIAPVAVCKNATVVLGANGSVTIPGSAINNGSSDNCGFSLSVSPATLSCANVGTSTVTLKATDAGGNTATCTAVVTVQDKTAPTALCKNINVFLDLTGHASITAADVNNGSSDNCTLAAMSINNSQFDCGQIGGSPVTVTLTVKDAYNNQSSCFAYVTVKDAIAPTAVCQDVTVQLNAQGSVVVYPAMLAAGSFDNCSVWSYSPTAKVYTKANTGVNNLTITVKDYSMNAATCVSQVTVLAYATNQSMAVHPGTPSDLFTQPMELKVYPNPTDGDLTIAFQLPQDQRVQLRVFDALGKLVLDRPLEGSAGGNILPIDLRDLSAGLYILDLQAGGQREMKRLSVQR